MNRTAVSNLARGTIPLQPLVCVVAAVLANLTDIPGLAAAPPSPPAFGAVQPAPASVPPEWRKGYELARVYCQACHLFPEPELLDKKHWPGAFRLMAPLLGIAKINLARRPDGAFLKESAVFPESPLISPEDWRAILDYYNHFAPSEPLPQKDPPLIQPSLSQFRPRLLTVPGSAHAASLIKIDPARRLYLGNAAAPSLDILKPSGELIARVPLESPPSSMEIRGKDLFLTLIGHVYPSDLPAGKLVVLQESGDAFTTQTLASRLPRPTHLTLTDMNGDGREDFLISSFGNYRGKFSWFESRPNGALQEHTLLERPGALRSIIADANRDGSPDLFVLMAQAQEGLFLFNRSEDNSADFSFTPTLQFHPLFGSTSFDLADFNSDGFLDVLLTNGDNGEYPSPPKAYHGIRVYLNDGKNVFREVFFFPFHGAFKAIAADFDRDGDLDIAAISFFPDYAQSAASGFVYLESNGPGNFKASSFPESESGRWLTMDAGDVDGDSDIDLVLGSFSEGPPSTRVPETLRARWRQNNISALVLENTTRNPPAH